VSRPSLGIRSRGNVSPLLTPVAIPRTFHWPDTEPCRRKEGRTRPRRPRWACGVPNPAEFRPRPHRTQWRRCPIQPTNCECTVRIAKVRVDSGRAVTRKSSSTRASNSASSAAFTASAGMQSNGCLFPLKEPLSRPVLSRFPQPEEASLVIRWSAHWTARGHHKGLPCPGFHQGGRAFKSERSPPRIPPKLQEII